eukprot:2720813-Alexandrium_andersonii.AAC.1
MFSSPARPCGPALKPPWHRGGNVGQRGWCWARPGAATMMAWWCLAVDASSTVSVCSMLPVMMRAWLRSMSACWR